MLLRPLALPDGPAVRRFAGDREVADLALNIPHPFPEGAAEEWIADTIARAALGTGHVFAILEKAGGELVGAMGLEIEPPHQRAELGYWIGRPYWGRGYATEAGRAVIRFGFADLCLHRIHANHIGGNPASGRVLTKLGLRYEGTLREHAFHRDRWVDLVCYGLLRSE